MICGFPDNDYTHRNVVMSMLLLSNGDKILLFLQNVKGIHEMINLSKQFQFIEMSESYTK